jgi:hypothetical protein
MPSTQTDVLAGISTSVAVKAPCRAVASSAITLAGLQTVGSVVLVADDRVLVAAQADSTENGIYSASTGQWQRTKDFDGSRDVVNGTLVVAVLPGGTNFFYRTVTDTPCVIGSSDIDFVTVTQNDDAAVDVQFNAISAVPLNLHDYIEDDGSYSAMGFIPQANKAAIRNYSSSADLTTFLQNWINAAIADQHSLSLPRGKYTHTGTLSISRSLNMRGHSTWGSGGSRLKYTGSGTQMGSINGGGDLTGLALSNLVLEGTNSGQWGLNIDNGYASILLDHIVIEGYTKSVGGTDPGSCFVLRDSYDVTMRACQFRQSNNGIVTQIGSVFGIVNTGWVDGCFITEIANRGVMMRSGTGWRVLADFSGLGSNAVAVAFGEGLTAGVNRQIKACHVLAGAYLEKAGGATNARGVTVGEGATIGTSAIQDVTIHGFYGDLTGDYVTIDYCRGAIIKDNALGAVSGGKKKVNISANAVATKVAMSNRVDITDNGSGTIYECHDLYSLPETVVTSFRVGGVSNAQMTKMFKGSKTHDFASVADGAVVNTTVTVTGAVLGDTVEVSLGVAVPANAILSGQVTAADTVTVTLFNKTGGALDLASATLTAITRRYT